MKSATIVGAGLVGSLWAVYLAKAGYKVTIVEMRDDLRKADISAGKSINLALSVRGWKAFKTVGVEKEIEEIAIPMYGRVMHSLAGDLTEQPYGQDGQAIYSVSRAGINCKMMDIAEKYGDATIIYNKQCLNADLDNGIVYLKDRNTGEETEIKSDVVFATDGAFSAVRYKSMQKRSGFNYSQHFIEDGYREILLPANEDGSYKLEKNEISLNFENKNYFYWMSSSAFKYAISYYPNIQNKFHFCGPGNTYNEIKKILGDDSKNLTVELSYKDWKNNILPSIE